MTTSPTTTTKSTPASIPFGSLLGLITRGLEALWLAAVILVPLVYLGQDYAVSEARIAYVEVPKVALLRTLAGFIFLLWAFEWAIKSHAFADPSSSVSIRVVAQYVQPSKLIPVLLNWLNVHPIRWFLIAAGMFFASTFVTTALSGSVTVSLWGEVPGQDGYAAYTILSYGIIFGVIATHLKTRAQLGRFISAVILMGTLVGLYSTVQHKGLPALEESLGARPLTNFPKSSVFGKGK